MKALPVARCAQDDCTLLMWAIYPMLPEALDLIAAWGFKYKTVALTWAKLNRKAGSYFMGGGYWTRANAEICLLATRGAPGRRSKSVRQLIASPVREHSRKPAETYARIEQLVPGPYLELFARTTRRGWHSWGNQTDKFRRAG
jgi:N6-adenosine-specific RNA methylase IME4